MLYIQRYYPSLLLLISILFSGCSGEPNGNTEPDQPSINPENKIAKVVDDNRKGQKRIEDFERGEDEKFGAKIEETLIQKFKRCEEIIVGKSSFKTDGVMESFPPIYQIRIEIVPSKIIAGNCKIGKEITLKHSLRVTGDPKFPEGEECIVGFIGKRDPLVIFFQKSNDDLVKNAVVAFKEKSAEDKKALQAAQNNPMQHPLFQPLVEAKQIAVVKDVLDPNADVAFSSDTNLETRSFTVVKSLKGDLKRNEKREFSIPAYDGTPSAYHSCIVIYSVKNEKLVVTLSIAPTTENLTVVASALGIKLSELEKLVKK